MKIGIDISQIVYGTGVSRYTEELVDHLMTIDKINEYVLFFSSLRKNYQHHNNILKNFKIPPTVLDFLWNRLHIGNIEYFIGNIDLFHSSDWTQPPSLSKKVTTVHDVSFLRYPDSFPASIINVHTRRLNWVKRECDLVIADSEASRKDLVEFLNFDDSKIRVVYLGVNDKFKVDNQKEKNKISEVKRKYKITGDYILSVGTLEPRKNLKRVIEAFLDIKCKEKLVLAGRQGWGGQLAENRENIVITGFADENDLPYLYAGAKCFVYPSLWEGFGLPVLEAMAAGCPVVTSNNSSLAEVGGSSALLVDPAKAGEISEAINKVLSKAILAGELSRKGKKRAEAFSWDKTARETLKIYEELGGKHLNRH